MDGISSQNIFLTSFEVSKHSVLTFGYCDYTQDGRPFYVGIGNLKRVKNKTRNKKHTNVVNKHGWFRVIETCISGSTFNETWSTACQWEIQTIVNKDTFHEPGKIGCNLTRGGDGALGMRHTKTKAQCQRISNTQRIRYQDPAEHLKTSIAIKKAKSDPIKLANHAKAQQLRYSDPDKRHRMHETNSQKKRVHQFTMDGVFIKEYPSMSYAVAETGIKNIKRVAWGKRKSAGGFIWRYIDEKETI